MQADSTREQSRKTTHEDVVPLVATADARTFGDTFRFERYLNQLMSLLPFEYSLLPSELPF